MKVNLKIVNELLLLEMILVLVPQVFLGFLATRSNNLILFLYASVIVMLVDFIGNIINHYADWEIDEVNNKRIELHRILSKRTLLSLALIFTVILFIMMLINVYLIFITLLGVVLAVFYSIMIKLKDRFLLNNITLGIAYAFVPYCAGYFVVSTDFQGFIELFWIPLYLIILMIIVSTIKDYEDEEGDRKFNKKTIVTTLGKNRALLLQSISISILFIFIIIWNILKQKLIILTLMIPFILFLILFLKMKKVKTSEEAHRIHMMVHLVLLVAYIALIPYFFF